MDDEDRFSNSSGDSDRDNDQDEVMEDAEEPDNQREQDMDADADADAEADAEAEAEADAEIEAEAAEAENGGEDDNNDDNNDDDDDDGYNNRTQETDNAADDNTTRSQAGDAAAGDAGSAGESSKRPKSATPAPTLRLRPTVRPEMMTARLYDIVPTMAAPQSTSINAVSITPDMRYWMTGGSDGYIRKYDGPGTINGKLTLTVAQKHPFVDSVHKAGILMSYWENEEPLPPGRGEQEHVLSPVYSLAVHSDALWLLSGLESGGINLQSVRYDEGKRITCLQKHTNAVSVLTLAQDEKSVLSGGWDKNIFDWDLNNGQVKRTFDGNAGQLSAIELRPASGAPIPAEADEPIPSDTISTNNGAAPTSNPTANGFTSSDLGNLNRTTSSNGAGADTTGEGTASPAHESLFGGSDAGSLFGETAGEQPFGQDDDEYATGMEMMPTHEGGMDHSADMAMAGIGDSSTGDASAKDAEKEPAPAVQPPGDADQVMEDSQQDTQQTVTGSEGPNASQNDPAASVSWIKNEDEQTQNGDNSHQQANEPSSPSQQLLQQQQQQEQQQQQQALGSQSPMLVTSKGPQTPFDATQVSPTTFLSAAMDGTIRLWDRRVAQPVARIGTRPGVPPWCMSACWSPDGNMIYAGRRNGTVEEFDVRKARRGWEPERTLKFPVGSGPISALRPMMNGRHLVCASHDILRLYDLQDTRAFKHSTTPFLIIPGPPRAGVISSLWIDPTSRFMISAAGTRGWEGTSTEVLIGYEINAANS